MPRNLLIQVRRDAAINWTTINPILAAGEFGHESDTGKMKTGDGVRTWVNLPYLSDLISDNVVTNAFLRDSVGLSVIGRSSTTTGDPEDIVANNDEEVLRRSGGTLAFGQITTGGIFDGAINSAKIADNTIMDADISIDADIAPAKLGPGALPGDVIITTPSYEVGSVTQSKLNDIVGPTGVGIWQTYDPVLTTDTGAAAGTYNILYSKYMKINELMMVKVVLQFTNATAFTNILYCSLPLNPVVPNLTVLGNAYHLNSEVKSAMPPINPIHYNNKVAFISHQGWWENNTTWPAGPEDKKGFYSGSFKTPDRLSFELCYEVA